MASLKAVDFSERHGSIKLVIRDIVHDQAVELPWQKCISMTPYKYRMVTEAFLGVKGMHTGQFIYCGKKKPKANLQIDNILPIRMMPEGTIFCCLEEKT